MLTHSLRLQFGRCSVRTFTPAALQILRDNQDLFSTFIEHKVDLSEAENVSLSRRCFPDLGTEPDTTVLQALRAEQGRQDRLCHGPIKGERRSVVL
jgi:hypothetical protein